MAKSSYRASAELSVTDKCYLTPTVTGNIIWYTSKSNKRRQNNSALTKEGAKAENFQFGQSFWRLLLEFSLI